MSRQDDRPLRVLGYVRVSTAEQASSGLGLAAQEAAIRAECDRRGWQLVGVERDEGATAATLDRPGLHAALQRCLDGEAQTVMAAKLDRISRSVVGLAALLEWAEEAHVGLVALDLGLDTSTDTGRLVAHVMSAVGEWERARIIARTREAAAAARAEGKRWGHGGVLFAQPKVAAQIKAARQAGRTWQAIADELNEHGVPTIRGGSQWRVSSVQAAAGYRRPPRRVRRGELPPLPVRRARAGAR